MPMEARLHQRLLLMLKQGGLGWDAFLRLVSNGEVWRRLHLPHHTLHKYVEVFDLLHVDDPR